MLAYPYTSKRFQESLQDGYCRAPDKPIFCEMPYKPRMTRMRQLAEDSGWHTVCGVEVALEGCFEQVRATSHPATKESHANTCTVPYMDREVRYTGNQRGRPASPEKPVSVDVYMCMLSYHL